MHIAEVKDIYLGFALLSDQIIYIIYLYNIIFGSGVLTGKMLGLKLLGLGYFFLITAHTGPSFLNLT